MIRGLATVNRSMNVLQKQMENTGANISNIKTPGYKFQKVLESTLPSEDMINHLEGRELNRRNELGEFIFGNQIDGAYRNFSQGSLIHTRHDTDLAIVGDGFFTIRLDNGELAYTKNGNFRVDENYRLVSLEGYPVLSEGLGEIYVGSDGINIGSRGEILGTNTSLNIVNIPDLDSFETIGGTIFTGGQGVYNNRNNVEVVQGFLEASNVNAADEIVDLIRFSRSFEANQKALHTADDTLSKAVNEIGRV